mmetsp:Transcript_55487/g.166392  ORF Transcript_55487/g.166392 Transcript_55487/m.166392 type:complete len:156 (-) Transcript_55487:309-776(-)|eukprot:CAMPEP_0113557230 /NCGR_PEP_ID=MMETSP0015_2-20120614/17676_1 /TAXON_ID=2838 /ORGANISM="Odontella" /LENGTH=155 /DNA_ID=CAMNT_0000458633 /DNA_START=212 /DNA_END=679 /DNA_ORIENTATION=- /assembly_acc=CAM_ASM_000160
MAKKLQTGVTKTVSLLFIIAMQLCLCVDGAFLSTPKQKAFAFTGLQQSALKTGGNRRTVLSIGTGLTFDDGDQILVSAQKPLGIILEEREEGGVDSGCLVAEVGDDSAVARAGVQVGDWLVAVQNADVSRNSIEQVMSRIGNAPRVVNLRFQRGG